MIEQSPSAQPAVRRALNELPTAEDYADGIRRRRIRFLVLDLLLAVVVAAVYSIFQIEIPIIPVVLVICVVTPVFLWRYSNLGLYIVFGAACLLELIPLYFPDSITDRLPFFWNVNTIIQVYASQSNFHAVPLNLMEVFVLLVAAISTIRSVYTSTASVRLGTLFWPIFGYMTFVLIGWLIGMTSGGDLTVSLQEVRSQFYFMLAYIMAVNVVRDRRQINTLLWIMVTTVGTKGVLLTFRRFVTLHGLSLSDQGVGEHEEAFFFDGFILLMPLLQLAGIHKKLRTWMWMLMPFVVIGNLSCNRRAGTAAVIIVIPILMAAIYQAFPRKRKLVTALCISVPILFFFYYSAFKNSESLIAQPARAVHSQISPDERDASSNAYRDAENADLYATIKSQPILGYGYGKHMFHVAQIADISKQYEWWDIMTHNQILWVWMRVGTVGAIAFWFMIASILIRAGQIVRNDTLDIEARIIAIFTMMVIGLLMIFGLLDLQLSNFRDMLYAGFWAGVVAALPSFAPAAARAPGPGTEMRSRRSRRDELVGSIPSLPELQALGQRPTVGVSSHLGAEVAEQDRESPI